MNILGINDFLKIGTNIKNIRLDRGYTQKEVAEMLGIPYSTYSNYENNNREPNFETIKQITEILDTSVDEILYAQYNISAAYDVAQYLFKLAGYVIYDTGDGLFTAIEANLNDASEEHYLTFTELNEFIADVTKYTTFTLNKMFDKK